MQAPCGLLQHMHEPAPARGCASLSCCCVLLRRLVSGSKRAVPWPSLLPPCGRAYLNPPLLRPCPPLLQPCPAHPQGCAACTALPSAPLFAWVACKPSWLSTRNGLRPSVALQCMLSALCPLTLQILSMGRVLPLHSLFTDVVPQVRWRRGKLRIPWHTCSCPQAQSGCVHVRGRMCMCACLHLAAGASVCACSP